MEKRSVPRKPYHELRTSAAVSQEFYKVMFCKIRVRSLGYGSLTELTEVSGKGMEVSQNSHSTCRIGYDVEHNPQSLLGMGKYPSNTKRQGDMFCRVRARFRVRSSYLSYRDVGNGYGSLTELTEAWDKSIQILQNS